MLFERFEDPGLSQYSYAVGCPADGRIAIVDPRRDVDVYLRFAARRGVRISHVLETHIHADYASGARELALLTGALLLASGHDRGEKFEVSMPHQDLFDGESIEIGPVRIEALHTPGHTPEHLSFLVYDRDRSSATPMLLLSGDFLLIGSLGRPDLLGDSETERLAKRLSRAYGRCWPRCRTASKSIRPTAPARSAGPAGAGAPFRPSATSGRPTPISTLSFRGRISSADSAPRLRRAPPTTPA